jgi:hypothetical protein
MNRCWIVTAMVVCLITKAVQKIDYMTMTDREQPGQDYIMAQQRDVLDLKPLIIFMHLFMTELLGEETYTVTSTSTYCHPLLT